MTLTIKYFQDQTLANIFEYSTSEIRGGFGLTVHYLTGILAYPRIGNELTFSALFCMC